MSQHDEDNSFFERERDRLAREITSVCPRYTSAVPLTDPLLKGFEELLSSTNGLNRKLEEVLGMTREYDTIASLWQSFYQLMSGPELANTTLEEQMPGLPGTGGHVVASKPNKDT